jgi:hypothetical protein
MVDLTGISRLDNEPHAESQSFADQAVVNGACSKDAWDGSVIRVDAPV